MPQKAPLPNQYRSRLSAIFCGAGGFGSVREAPVSAFSLPTQHCLKRRWVTNLSMLSRQSIKNCHASLSSACACMCLLLMCVTLPPLGSPKATRHGGGWLNKNAFPLEGEGGPRFVCSVCFARDFFENDERTVSIQSLYCRKTAACRRLATPSSSVSHATVSTVPFDTASEKPGMATSPLSLVYVLRP